MKKRVLYSLSTLLLLTLNTNAQGVYKLKDITVTASDRFNTKVSDTTANVVVITGEDIEDRGYKSIEEVLSNVSGFSVSSNGGAGANSSVYLRGFGSGNVKFLLDGVPLSDPTDPSFSSSIPNVMISNVDRIEIVKGAQSGLWGADAVAGVVNIVTKSNGNYLYSEYGKYSSKKAGFGIGSSCKAGDFYISGDYYKTNGFSALLPRDAEADGYKNKRFNFRASLNIDKNSKVDIFHNNIDANGEYDSSSNANSTLEKFTFKEKLYGIGYNYSKNGFELNAKASRNDIKRDYTSSFGISDFNGKSDRYSIDAKKILGKHMVSGGLEYNRYSSSTTYSKDSYNNKAIWAGYGYSFDELLGAKTLFNATLRYDKFNNFKNKFTYRVGVKRDCKFLPGLHSGFNVYSAYKTPSLYQFANPMVGIELNPESTNGFEFTLGYKRVLNITYFYAKTKDTIAFDGGSWKYYNLDYNIKRKGIEVSSSYNFEKLPLSIRFNYTHIFDVEDKKGNKFYRVPKNSANLFVDYYPTDNITIGANIQYVGKRSDLAYINYLPTDVELKSYTLVNLNYRQTINKNLSFSVSAKNVLNKKYESVKGYSTAGREISARVEYKF